MEIQYVGSHVQRKYFHRDVIPYKIIQLRSVAEENSCQEEEKFIYFCEQKGEKSQIEKSNEIKLRSVPYPM